MFKINNKVSIIVWIFKVKLIEFNNLKEFIFQLLKKKSKIKSSPFIKIFVINSNFIFCFFLYDSFLEIIIVYLDDPDKILNNLLKDKKKIYFL